MFRCGRGWVGCGSSQLLGLPVFGDTWRPLDHLNDTGINHFFESCAGLVTSDSLVKNDESFRRKHLLEVSLQHRVLSITVTEEPEGCFHFSKAIFSRIFESATVYSVEPIVEPRKNLPFR